ncbi:phage tail assembly chaperone [Burkholderia sp. AW49-1]
MGQKQAAYDAKGGIIAFYDTVDSPAPQGESVIDITDVQWLALIDAQAVGKCLIVDSAGKPAAIDPPPPTRAEIANAKRADRDAALARTDWLVARHQDEKLIGDGTTMTAEQFAALVKYRQALRDFTDAQGWPNIDLPTAPLFVTSAT